MQNSKFRIYLASMKNREDVSKIAKIRSEEAGLNKIRRIREYDDEILMKANNASMLLRRLSLLTATKYA